MYIDGELSCDYEKNLRKYDYFMMKTMMNNIV